MGKGRDSLQPAENSPWEGTIDPLASSWVSPRGLAERNGEVVGGSHPFSPNHVQEYTLYPEVSYPESGRTKSNHKNTIDEKFLALEFA